MARIIYFYLFYSSFHFDYGKMKTQNSCLDLCPTFKNATISTYKFIKYLNKYLKFIPMDELKPIVNEFLGQPVAFFGGLVSGFLKLDLQQDPLKSWLEKQGASPTVVSADSNSKKDGPQSISID